MFLGIKSSCPWTLVAAITEQKATRERLRFPIIVLGKDGSATARSVNEHSSVYSHYDDFRALHSSW